VAVAPVRRIENFGQALRASSDIGRDRRDGIHLVSRIAIEDAEPMRQLAGKRTLLDMVNPRQRRWRRLERLTQIADCVGRARQPDSDAFDIIADVAVEAAFARQPVDEGAKPDTLDDAADADFDDLVHNHLLTSAGYGLRRSR